MKAAEKGGWVAVVLFKKPGSEPVNKSLVQRNSSVPQARPERTTIDLTVLATVTNGSGGYTGTHTERETSTVYKYLQSLERETNRERIHEGEMEIKVNGKKKKKCRSKVGQTEPEQEDKTTGKNDHGGEWWLLGNIPGVEVG